MAEKSGNGIIAVDLFGRARIAGPGGAIEGANSGDRAIQVLAYLLFHRQGPVTRKDIGEKVFNCDAKNQVKYVSKAARVLENKFGIILDTLPNPVQIDVDVIDGDAVRFERILRKLEGAEAPEPWELNEARLLYKEPFLPGADEGAEWLEGVRSRLRDMYIECCDTLIRLDDLFPGGIDGAVDCFSDALRVCARVPKYGEQLEALCRRLLQNCFRANDPPSAERVYAAYSDCFEVSDETKVLFNSALLDPRPSMPEVAGSHDDVDTIPTCARDAPEIRIADVDVDYYATQPKRFASYVTVLIERGRRDAAIKLAARLLVDATRVSPETSQKCWTLLQGADQLDIVADELVRSPKLDCQRLVEYLGTGHSKATENALWLMSNTLDSDFYIECSGFLQAAARPSAREKLALVQLYRNNVCPRIVRQCLWLLGEEADPMAEALIARSVLYLSSIRDRYHPCDVFRYRLYIENCLSHLDQRDKAKPIASVILGEGKWAPIKDLPVQLMCLDILGPEAKLAAAYMLECHNNGTLQMGDSVVARCNGILDETDPPPVSKWNRLLGWNPLGR